MKFFAALHDHPRLVAFLGTLSGWASVDLLRTAQIAAAILAATVSLCALILTAPKALTEVRRWFLNSPRSPVNSRTDKRK
jgi:hypothetical protein